MASPFKTCLLTMLLVYYACGQTIVSRAGWGARAPRSRSTMRTPVSTVFIHHTAGGRCFSKTQCSQRVRSIQNYHMNTRRWSDIAYSFLVGEDGRVYEGRGWTRTGAHTRGYNSRSIAICFIGNFQSVTTRQVAVTATFRLIAQGIRRGYLRSNTILHGHRDVASTACPGNVLYARIHRWRRYRKP